MGLSKLVKISDRKVRLVHQLDGSGAAYAEDVTIELQQGVDASRLSWLTLQDGQIGIASFSFTPANPQPEGLTFPSGD